jgi:hypothetical protein
MRAILVALLLVALPSLAAAEGYVFVDPRDGTQQVVIIEAETGGARPEPAPGPAEGGALGVERGGVGAPIARLNALGDRVPPLRLPVSMQCERSVGCQW